MGFVMLLTVVLRLVTYSQGTAMLTVPTAGNCGEDTVLICNVTPYFIHTRWKGLGRYLSIDGRPYRPEDKQKYIETRDTSSFTLTIRNTSLHDEGDYKCFEELYASSSDVHLYVECKATSSVLFVTDGKKIMVSVDKLHPASTIFNITFRQENTDFYIPGSETCYNSTQFSGYCTCTWTSSNSLPYGLYTYNLVVTTVTQSDPLNGTFNIMSPRTPVIINKDTDDSRALLKYNEGQSLTIVCTSTGGFPAPTLYWYKESISTSNRLAKTSNGTLLNDGTYSVILQHVLSANLVVTLDRKQLICRSYYPDADIGSRDSKQTHAILYLNRPPSPPSNLTIDMISNNRITLSWTRGYHGNLSQTFVIQVSQDNERWTNGTSVIRGNDENDERVTTDLEGLKSLTTYYLRLYAFNMDGQSVFTTSVGFTTLAYEPCHIEAKHSCSSEIIGGSLGALMVVVSSYATLITFLYIKLRRHINKDQSQQSVSKNDRRTYANVAFGLDNTGPDIDTADDNVNQYTSLDERSRDDRSMYEVIQQQ